MTSTERMIDIINERYGRHAGRRALHAKGTVLTGTFTATPAAARLTRAAHMQGAPVPVTARLSNGGGDPEEGDGVPDVRGFALKFLLPDGTKTDIVAQTSPSVPTTTVESFAEFIPATAPEPSSLLKMANFIRRHPAALKAIAKAVPSQRPAASYATIPYYALHAFKWLDADGGSRYVRYTLLPEAQRAYLSLLEVRRKGPDYLRDELLERLARGPIRFLLEVQIAGPGDDPDSLASVWPDDRERVVVGTVELTGLDTERERDGDILLFDPTRLTAGIEASQDEILLYRSRAYSESVKRRTGVERPDALKGTDLGSV